jgi:hypothetical protein
MALSPAAITTITGGTFFLNDWNTQKCCFLFKHFFLELFIFFLLLIFPFDLIIIFHVTKEKVSKSKRLRIFETLVSLVKSVTILFFPSAVSGLVVCSSEI